MQASDPDPAPDGSRTPRPWIATCLSLFLLPGLGHLYNGELRPAVVGILLTVLLQVFILMIGAVSFASYTAATSVRLLWILAVAAHAGVRARRIGTVPPRRFNRWWAYALVPLLVYGGLAALKTHVRFRAYRIPAASMAPTLLPGDYVFVDTWWYVRHPPVRGDVVVFLSPTDAKAFIKRCVAVAGDTVEIRNRVLYVNGDQMDEPYVQHSDVHSFGPEQGPRDFMSPVVVPDEHIFMLGDNRDNSSDSRFWGPLPVKQVHGKALYIYWSLAFDQGTAFPRIRWRRFGQAAGATIGPEHGAGR